MATLPEVKCWLANTFANCFTKVQIRPNKVYLLTESYKVRKLGLPECRNRPVLNTKGETNTIKLRNVLDGNVYSKTAGVQNSAWKYFFFSYSHLLNYFLLNDLPSTFLQLFWTSPFLSLPWNCKTLDSVGKDSNCHCYQAESCRGSDKLFVIQASDPPSNKTSVFSDHRRTVTIMINFIAFYCFLPVQYLIIYLYSNKLHSID